MNERDRTGQHIIQAALRLFLEQGIKRTTVDEIAHAAGLTRVTIYRYFPQREQLVQATFRHLVAPFVKARELVEDNPQADIETVLDSIARELAQMPRGDLASCVDELRRGYPPAYGEFTCTRQEALKVLFERLFSIAERQQRLRPGLNRAVVEAYFMETIINILESPALQMHGVPPVEVYNTVKAIFLYGILKGSNT